MSQSAISSPLALSTLGRLVQLHTIVIGCPPVMWRGKGRRVNPYPHLATFLKALYENSPSSVSAVTFRVEFDYNEKYTFPDGKSFWNGVDHILSSRANFPKMTRLKYEATLRHYGTREGDVTAPSERYAQDEQDYWSETRAAGVAVKVTYYIPPKVLFPSLNG